MIKLASVLPVHNFPGCTFQRESKKGRATYAMFVIIFTLQVIREDAGNGVFVAGMREVPVSLPARETVKEHTYNALSLFHQTGDPRGRRQRCVCGGHA